MMQNKTSLRGILLLSLASLFWGFAFVAQKKVVEVGMAPFGCNLLRFAIGALILLPLIMGADKFRKSQRTLFSRKSGRFSIDISKRELKGGVLCGCFLFFATTLQQYGLDIGTEAGKSAFLTVMYIVMVPVLRFFAGKRAGWHVWTSVLVSLFGVWMLSVGDFSGNRMQVGAGDLLTLLCALAFSFHILAVDRSAGGVDGLRLAFVQFATVAVLCSPTALLVESLTWQQIAAGALPILYLGVFSCGGAYTLQILGQQQCGPVLASLIICLESVIAAFGGWWLLGEQMSRLELIGCFAILLAVAFAQLPLQNPRLKSDKTPPKT
ncbi:MAG: DMT family transporter [Eubacteriales bacterium]